MGETEKTTLKRIHEAATAEFMEKGFQAASLRNIVKNAGVTTGAFYGYYGSKEELFRSLVGETYDYFMNGYKESLYAFEKLPMEEQPENMGHAGRDCMIRMLEYSYGHRDACHLLLQCSKGTRFAFMVDEMIELEVDSTRKYCEVLKKLGKEVPVIDKRLEHILVTGMMNAYFEIMIHDVPKENAMHYVEELNDFYTAGWEKIMGQTLK